MILLNTGFEQFLENSKNKKIVCFGAGQTPIDVFSEYKDYQLEKKIAYFLDNDKDKVGSFLQINDIRIPVLSPESLYQEDVTNTVLFITSKYYLELIKMLDEEDAFKDLCVYICLPPYMISCNHYAKISLSDFNTYSNYEIPKTIHYCWFGRGSMGEKELSCIESWKHFCPEYKLCLWNEDNYDITKNKYMYEAYKNERWSFVSDYARLDIIYEHGGIYLDTDVELIKSMDSLTSYRGFLGFENRFLVSTGLGFGAIRHLELIKELRDLYEEIPFLLQDKSLNLQPCPIYHTDFFKKRGIRAKEEIQLYDDILILPEEFLCPMNQDTGLLQLSSNTFSIHHFFCSWFQKHDLEVWNTQKKGVEKLNQRLRRDFDRWKRLEKVNERMSGDSI